jgi:type IV secretion system protein VirB9
MLPMKYCNMFLRVPLLLATMLMWFSTVLVLHAAEEPITTDTRIKTYVYSENEVYRVVVHHGFQTNIEFADKEEIETLSVGDAYAWNITPLGKRLFIKPLEENIHTNLTVITNKRSYQFELLSTSPDDTTHAQLAYLIRFYYPQDAKKKRSILTDLDDEL